MDLVEISPMPILHYVPESRSPMKYVISSPDTVLKRIMDTDRWKGLGRTMKIRRQFTQICHVNVPKYCKIATTRSVVKQAAKWSAETGAKRPYDAVQTKWKSKQNGKQNYRNR
jgi:hypothetical protein